MALTRKFLAAMDIDPDKIDEIINAHADTVNALKEERDIAKKDAESYKSNADKYESVKKELDELKESDATSVYKKQYDDMKEAHDKIKAEYDQYKSDISAKELKQAKEKAYRELLKAANISDKRIDSVVKVSDLESIELDKDGAIKDKENLTKSIKEEWKDFIVDEHQTGANVANPNHTQNNVPKGESRAAKIAAQYHNNLYGETKEAN